LANDAAHDRFDAGREFPGVEWLRKVVIGANFETDNPINRVTFSRNNDDRNI